jgi:molybdopterin converting factor small subunit
VVEGLTGELECEGRVGRQPTQAELGWGTRLAQTITHPLLCKGWATRGVRPTHRCAMNGAPLPLGYSGRMRVRVLYFGVLREMLGRADEAMELGEGATVGELVGVLRGRASNESMVGVAEADGDRLWRSIAVAVNREYAGVNAVLRDEDEFALLPPVSGGLLRAERKARFARCFAHGEKLASLADASRGRQ